ncbi:MAG: substrate-binding domain-containing protein [Planctomycetota bacterium]
MPTALDLNFDFPARGASGVLLSRLERFLRESATPGEPFLTDAEVVERSRLSRSTVRRAMDDLQKRGLIEREIGRGTFVGPAVLLDRDVDDASTSPAAKSADKTLRLAVVVAWNHPHLKDWYTPQILRGIDDAADEHRLSVELLGCRNAGDDALVRRFRRAEPDVAVCLMGAHEELALIGEAKRLDVPVLSAGTDAMTQPMPTVAEDNRQGIALAVRHLLEHGHRRIGLALPARPGRWVFDRASAYRRVLRANDIERDENLVHWHELDDSARDSEDAFGEYLDRAKPTAVILGNRVVAHAAEQCLQRRGVHVPDDLSIVTFDEDPDAPRPIVGVHSTYIRLPLEAMGAELGRMARLVADGARLPEEKLLPCSLVEGESVAAVS